MADSWEDQRNEQRRRDDQATAIWRGEIATKVDAQGKAIDVTNDRLNGLQAAVSSVRQDVAVMKTTMRDQGDDISRAQTSNTRILLGLIFPLLVVIIGGLVLYALTGAVHG